MQETLGSIESAKRERYSQLQAHKDESSAWHSQIEELQSQRTNLARDYRRERYRVKDTVQQWQIGVASPGKARNLLVDLLGNLQQESAELEAKVLKDEEDFGVFEEEYLEKERAEALAAEASSAAGKRASFLQSPENHGHRNQLAVEKIEERQEEACETAEQSANESKIAPTARESAAGPSNQQLEGPTPPLLTEPYHPIPPHNPQSNKRVTPYDANLPLTKPLPHAEQPQQPGSNRNKGTLMEQPAEARQAKPAQIGAQSPHKQSKVSQAGSRLSANKKVSNAGSVETSSKAMKDEEIRYLKAHRQLKKPSVQPALEQK